MSRVIRDSKVRQVSDRVPYLASRLQGFGTTIFAEMSALAVETGSVNLGQGFPDTDGPPEVMQAAIDAIKRGENQYPPGPGTADLRLAIAEHQQHWYGLSFDPDTEILVTAGATGGDRRPCSLCEPGDEVVTFEPYYDSYPRHRDGRSDASSSCSSRPPGYTFDPDALRRDHASTRLLLINSPHNPTGKKLSRRARGHRRACLEHDLIAVTDEVYEHIVFDGAHIPLATFARACATVRHRSPPAASRSRARGGKIGWWLRRPHLCGRSALRSSSSRT
jgi:N-succinyldiaminopimelate aminotransferase